MFRPRTSCFLCVLFIALFSAKLDADLTLLSIPQTSVSPGGVAHVVNDLNISFSGQLSTQELLISLTSGSIYQHAGGANVPPTSFFVTSFPDLAFDSFVALDELVDASPAPSIAGGATDIAGGASAIFNSSMADIAWFPPGGTVISSGTDFTVARVTLSSDATGTWRFLSTTTTGNGYVGPSAPLLAGPNVDLGAGMIGQISGGVMSIPEPSSLAFGFVAVSMLLVPKVWSRFRQDSVPNQSEL